MAEGLEPRSLAELCVQCCLVQTVPALARYDDTHTLCLHPGLKLPSDICDRLVNSYVSFCPCLSLYCYPYFNYTHSAYPQEGRLPIAAFWVVQGEEYQGEGDTVVFHLVLYSIISMIRFFFKVITGIFLQESKLGVGLTVKVAGLRY